MWVGACLDDGMCIFGRTKPLAAPALMCRMQRRILLNDQKNNVKNNTHGRTPCDHRMAHPRLSARGGGRRADLRRQEWAGLGRALPMTVENVLDAYHKAGI